ncbi:hypothetical protein CCAX7_21580 [Capsulimonas corticalis]|uniref:Uncharacterized protein n=1 Tax=Capsulimonas corticalis TaxID=2219043 RepID=A0A402D250_9BACT|nr:carboxypeptidase-like regulatory domain-containing protein [Capsulimonas corticalis]BDI30107.1 hypothetical protein CCAX7_21580 [Capsulimonas corticalis]
MLDELGNVENLRGRVLGPDGKPSSNAHILLYMMFSEEIDIDLWPQMSFLGTDADGGFSVEMPPGVLSVRLRARDGHFVTREALALTMPANDVTLQLDENAAVSLTGIVRNEEGQAIAGSLIVWYLYEVHSGFGYPARTQDDGRFLIGDLWPDLSYGVEIHAEGYELTRRYDLTAPPPGETCDLGAISPQKALYHVAGQLLDEWGAPVAGVLVTAEGPQTHLRQQVSDADGRFHITGVGSGSVDINVLHGERSAWMRLQAGDPDVKVIVK